MKSSRREYEGQKEKQVYGQVLEENHRRLTEESGKNNKNGGCPESAEEDEHLTSQ